MVAKVVCGGGVWTVLLSLCGNPTSMDFIQFGLLKGKQIEYININHI